MDAYKESDITLIDDDTIEEGPPESSSGPEFPGEDDPGPGDSDSPFEDGSIVSGDPGDGDDDESVFEAGEDAFGIPDEEPEL